MKRDGDAALFSFAREPPDRAVEHGAEPHDLSGRRATLLRVQTGEGELLREDREPLDLLGTRAQGLFVLARVAAPAQGNFELVRRRESGD